MQFNMITASKNKLRENESKWNHIPLFVEKVGALETKANLISGDIKKQWKANTKIFDVKDELKHDLALMADSMNDVAEVRANIVGDIDLAHQMRESKSDLLRLPDTIFTQHTETIKMELVSNKEFYTETLKIPAETLDAFYKKNEEWKAYTAKINSDRGNSREATQAIKRNINEVLDILNNDIDNLMKIFRHTDPDFYNGYIAARTIIDN